MVYHNQIDATTSSVIKNFAVLICATIGTIIGSKLGAWGSVIGCIIGGVLGIYVTAVIEAYVMDELGCIWWWIGSYFWDWLIANAEWLGGLALLNPTMAEDCIIECFNDWGYIRIGAITFGNNIGIGDPEPPPSDGNGGGGGGCPILSVYDGSEYVEEGSLNIHSVEDTVVYHELTVTPEEMNQKYYLRLTEPDLPESHSYIDQVKLLVTYSSGETVKCPLIGAEHSEDGNILYELLLSDDVRTDTEPYEYIDLTFVAPKGEIDHYTFVIEGYNIKTPFP